ncbi:hypothetical protein CDV36_000849 [Fusarium kuroshium]|uniref:LysM domain-containing protein n=1 Tax=Fusarium kuroshium TaxID=2010991 RepID=A0A3M2SQQ0_9HYPO|nr:hypothetical protein CDV36_000849 [Fusarium kuroshium]
MATPSVPRKKELEAGDINCRGWAQTYEHVDGSTCQKLAEDYHIDLGTFYELNPILESDCKRIRPYTEYCYTGFIEPLRAHDGKCGPLYNNATCLGTDKPCCNTETWTCGNRERDCTPSLCYRGAGNCFLRVVVSTDGYRATEIRAATQRLRADASQFIVPEQRLGHLPEMECFVEDCDCLFYDGLERPNEANSHHESLSTIVLSRAHSIQAANGMRVHSCFTRASPNKLPCLFFQYNMKIFGSDSLGGPNHQWFHALDPVSYKYSGLVGARETCADTKY